jgi:hypothetical protein
MVLNNIKSKTVSIVIPMAISMAIITENTMA